MKPANNLFPGFFIRIFCVLVIIASTAGNAFSQNENLPPRMLAYQYLQQNQVNEAEFAFLKAIKTDPNEILNYRDLAVLYLSKKNYTKAESTAKAGLKLKPDDPDVKSVLAKIYLQKNDRRNAIIQLNSIARKNSRNVFAWYSFSGLAADIYLKERYLFKVLSLSPANVVARLNLAELLISNNKADSAIFYLQGIKKTVPAFSPALNASYSQLTQSLSAKDFLKAKTQISRFKDLLALTSSYIESMALLAGPQLPVGYAAFASSQVQNKGQNTRRGYATNKGFTDATKLIGLGFNDTDKATDGVIAVTDYTDAGEMYLYTSSITGGKQKCRLLTSKIGSFQETDVPGGIDHDAADHDAAFIDYDNNGYPDLFVATAKGILLYRNNSDGTFAYQRNDIGLGISVNVQKIIFADFDQDGDLDLYASTTTGNKFFRNNSNGTFTEQVGAMGLAISGAAGMDFSDYDGDGDLDVVVASETKGVTLLNNNRHSKFTNATASAGLKNSAYNGKAVAFADYNNDGLPDLFIAGNGQQFLLKNVSGNRFTADAASKTVSTALQNVKVYDAAFLDYDNDGYADLLVAGTTNTSSNAVFLFHNENAKSFSDASSLLPQTTGDVTGIAIADFNSDGDDDIFLAGPGGIKLIRNDIGSLNHYMQVQLTGLTYGSNKNNRLGIGAQEELNAGDLYQVKTIKRSITTFGVGIRTSLDAVRIIWPNGTPQYIKDPSASERIIEEQMLKGSCPFLYAWNGEKYAFVKDMMWRSALGMPLAINGKDTTYAFSDASKEYLLIPGDNIKPKDGKYSIKITEELWEAVYFDKAELIAVDHPDSVDVFADERFTPPPFAGKKLYSVADKYYPLKAADGNGDDMLDKIKAYDFQYISNFGMGKFQGLAEDHDLILDLGDKASANNLHLFLRGWIFPADASINTSMAQADTYRQKPPSLQVIDKDGNWKKVIPNIGFPMGKDKMVIVDLSNKFLTKSDRRVRIQTNMQIYWDEIFFSNGLSKAPVNMHDLTMTSASLDYRGYSSTYTKGGPFGPHWFDYYNVSGGQKWRDLTGNYTRYGDVLPLLKQADDEYIICNSGDEISIDFDASNLPALPKGWKRDFLIYSEGWVKDGDLNTAYGQTVEPLPFHNMPAYPYSGELSYPAEQHKTYMQRYNTRKVSTDKFSNALKR